MFDIQYLMSEWHDKGAILPSGLKHVLKQGMKILGVSVHWKWDRLVTYWLVLVFTLSIGLFGFNRPVNTIKVMSSWSVHLTTLSEQA